MPENKPKDKTGEIMGAVLIFVFTVCAAALMIGGTYKAFTMMF